MGVTYISDPTPGRHTAGSASWNETFNSKFPMGKAVDEKEVSVGWHDTAGKGVAQAHFSNAHQVLNGLGLCMFTNLTGVLPWLDLTNALTGWGLSDRELLRAGERIQNLRAAFNLREGILPGDFKPHPRMLGQGDGNLPSGPLKGVTVPLEKLKHEGAVRAWGVCARDGPEDAPSPPIVQAPAFEPLAARAAARGAGVMGIEVLRNATPDLRMPTRISDLWYLARGLRRGAVAASSATPEALLRRALTTPHLASALVTTTRTAHLEANIAVARTLRA
jgi:hypothetical protein